jgi:hypothetical protein
LRGRRHSNLPRLLALVIALAAGGALLTGCDIDDGGEDTGATQPTTTERAAGRRPGPGKAIEFAAVERLTLEYLSEHPDCPPGEFEPTEAFLTTLPRGASRKTAQPPQSYSCGGRVDQVVYAEFEDPADARALLDPRNTANSASLVAEDIVVLVNFGLEKRVDIAGFFKAIRRECDCGRTRYERPRRRDR